MDNINGAGLYCGSGAVSFYNCSFNISIFLRGTAFKVCQSIFRHLKETRTDRGASTTANTSRSLEDYLCHIRSIPYATSMPPI